jgi:hypothetical protein
MTKITIHVSGAGAEASMEGPGVTTTALDLAARNAVAGALNAGSAPSLGEATTGVAPIAGSADVAGGGGAGQPIEAGPPPERLFEMIGGDQ